MEALKPRTGVHGMCGMSPKYKVLGRLRNNTLILNLQHHGRSSHFNIWRNILLLYNTVLCQQPTNLQTQQEGKRNQSMKMPPQSLLGS